MRIRIEPTGLPMHAVACAMILMSASAAYADDKNVSRSPIIKSVVDCRSIADGVARLACYDDAVAKLDIAEQAREVVVMDKSEVAKTRRGLFGLSLPKLAIFGDGEDGGDGVDQIESSVRNVSRDADSRWIIWLEDGAKWRQIDGTMLGRSPKSGSKVLVKKAALGSFMMKIDGGTAIRVRREN